MSIDKIEGHDPAAQSKDLLQENIDKLKTLFPEVVAEGKVDFEVLRDILGDEVETEEEYYRFTWAGKSQARREAHKPSRGTLRPAKNESVNWDHTQNLYLEGDNLEVLKLLQKSYAGKVKMIYIDPPYNTGKDFVYKDDYKDNLGNYNKLTDQVDAEGNSFSTNSDSHGRFHSNWLNMIYPRLKLARNLLRNEGMIFISIDDNEQANLKKLCDEIFGEENFIGDIAVAKGTTTGQDAKLLGSSIDRLFFYSKNKDLFSLKGLPLNADDKKRFSHEDEKGKYSILQFRKTGTNDRREDRPNLFYPLIDPDGNEIYPYHPSGYESCWRTSKESFLKWQNENLIVWKKDAKNGKYKPYVKYYLKDRTKAVSNLWKDVEGNKKASHTLTNLFNAKIFDFPKPVGLVKRCITLGLDANDICLDFFSGSGSTAHAVMDFNAATGSNCRHIQVQIPEDLELNSEAYKAGYTNIAEIGKERIRRAGRKIKKEKEAELAEKEAALEKLQNKGELFEADEEKVKTLQEEITNLKNVVENLDIGFKVFKLDSSNIRAWDGSPENLEDNLFKAVTNLKEDRSEVDILYEILLKYGIDLTVAIEEKELGGETVYSVGDGAIFICLGDKITTAVAEGIGAWKEELAPETCRVVFKDSGLSDVAKTNATQILKRYGVEEVRSI